jgi:RNA polymerase sigma-70 factor (ECF subfamily)
MTRVDPAMARRAVLRPARALTGRGLRLVADRGTRGGTAVPRGLGCGAQVLDGREGLSPDTPDGHRAAADGELMAAVAGGDDAPYTRLVDAEAPRLMRFARSILVASPAEAEEVVQEALMRLWQQADSWQPHGRVSTWLHQVVYRLCIDSIRRRRPSVDIGTLESELEDDAPLADERLAREDDARRVQSAIGRLPDRQRTALVLCHYQDLGQAEAAAIMGIGESAYESLLARARRRLRVWLAAEPTGEPAP